MQKWRFALIVEVWGERCENQRARHQLLDVLLNELMSSSPANQPSALGREGLQAEQQTDISGNAAIEGEASNPKEALIKIELLVGILAVLPYRSELDVGHLLMCASSFLTLHAAPLLSESMQPASANGFFDTCAASALLFSLCAHLCVDAAEIQRLLVVGVADVDDQPLPGSFWRRPQFDITELVAALLAAAGNSRELVSLLQRHVPMDSPLLHVVECQGGGTQGRVTVRGCRRRRSVGGRGRQCSPGDAGEHKGTEGAEGDAENETPHHKTDRPIRSTGVKRQRRNSKVDASDMGGYKQPPQNMEGDAAEYPTMEQ